MTESDGREQIPSQTQQHTITVRGMAARPMPSDAILPSADLLARGRSLSLNYLSGITPQGGFYLI